MHNACRHLASIYSNFFVLLLLLSLKYTIRLDFISFIFVVVIVILFDSIPFAVIRFIVCMNFALNHYKMEVNRNKMLKKKLYVRLANMDRKRVIHTSIVLFNILSISTLLRVLLWLRSKGHHKRVHTKSITRNVNEILTGIILITHASYDLYVTGNV